MGKIQVNPSTGKVLVSRDSSGISKLCNTCCIPLGGYADNDCGCFIYGAGPPTCASNPDFDEQPPFGGPGKTPGVYTVTIDGYILCPFPLNSPAPDINGVWHLPYFGGDDDCTWSYNITIGGIAVVFTLELCDSFTFPQFQVSAPGETLFRRDPTQCDIVVDNAPNFFAGCGTPGEVSGYGGTVSWRPGQILAWDSGTSYEIGDMVAHEGVFYVCTAGNTNQEPPNASYWDVA